MTDYDAGRARATWELEAMKGEQTIARLKKGLLELEQIQQRVGKASFGASGSGAAVNSTNALSAAQARALKTTSDLALSEQKLRSEEQRTAREIANTAKAQDQAATAALRRSQAEARASAPRGSRGGGPTLPRSAEFFGPEAIGQLLGVSLGPQLVTQAIGFAKSAATEALALRETQNSLRVVAGDTKTYNNILTEAKRQQVLFGGTLQDNIAGLQGLAITSRSSGAALTTLIDLSKRLAVLDPAQGAEGARIALNEALSGDPTSLAKRYEIPRAALAKLRDTSLPVAERLNVINTFLNNVGITSESVAGKVDATAVAYRTLGQEVDTARVSFGGLVADGLAPAANGLARLIGIINQNPRAFAELKAVFSGKSGITEQDITEGSTVNAALRARNAVNGNIGAGRTQAALGGEQNYLAVVNQLTALTLASDEAGQAGERLTQQWLSGAIPSAVEYQAQLKRLYEQQVLGISILGSKTVSEDAATAAQNKQATELQQLISDKLKDNEATQRQNQLNQELARLGQQVHDGTITAAQGAIIFANSLGLTGDAAVDARSKLIDLLNVQAQLTAPTKDTRQKVDLAGATAFFQNFDSQVAGLRRDRTFNNLDTAGQVGFLKNELKGLVPGTLAYEKQLNAVSDAERRLKEERGRSKGVKGLSNVTTSDLVATDDLTARLAKVNEELKKGNLTIVQRNQLLKDQHDLERQITDLQLSTAELIIRNKRASEKEQRQLLGLDKLAARGGRRGDIAADTAQLIRIGQAQRINQINDNLVKTGGKIATIGPTPTIGNLTGVPTGIGTVNTAATAVTVNLSIALDPSTGDARLVGADPNVSLNLSNNNLASRHINGTRG